MYSTLIETAQLADLLGTPELVVLDCRFNLKRPEAGREAWRESHIPGAHYAHLDDDMASAPDEDSGRHPLPAIDTLAAQLGAWGIQADSQVVVYDDAGGAIAGRMWWLLRWSGHSSAALLNGGWPKWTREGRPVSDDMPPESEVLYAASPQEDLWLTTAAVVDALDQDQVQLIDARAPERFSGQHEPLDAVGGHIPGSQNLPFQENLDENGCFKPPEALRQRFESLADDPRSVCHSCGSGVTACHNFLAMAHAGLEPGRLYVGSWSEWIRDPSRPIATGNT